MEIISWMSANIIELIGTLSGLLYLVFSVRQNILLWPLGLATSALYTVVFFNSRLYADMGLQVYYVIISIYGWYFWLRGKRNEKDKHLRVGQTNQKTWFWLIFSFLVLFFAIYKLLVTLPALLSIPASDLPGWDAFTTAASIIATWMLARKLVENWLLWIVIDAVSFGLYIYKELYSTVVLFFVYTVVAIIGYFAWKKDILKHSPENVS